MIESPQSRFDSLKSTIPPSEDGPLKSKSPSPVGSQFTNPCFSGPEGRASSEDDLPSLSEITSTARSGRVSPPHLKKSKKARSPELPSNLDHQASSTEMRTETQTSSRFQPSQIPPGSQFVDLTFSSDPISPEHSDGDYASTQKSSVRIKQSSSQVKPREPLSGSTKAGNRRLIRGRSGRYTS
jgi:hypothetical protein